MLLPAQPFDLRLRCKARHSGDDRHYPARVYRKHLLPAFAEHDEGAGCGATKYGERTDDFLKAFGQGFPGYQPKDLVDVDFIFRPGAVEQAKLKSAQQGAPVYMYMFAWESPVMDGILRSTHCMEIPFVFNNVVRHASMTGGGKAAQVLADKMSSAWLNFARTGNPNTEGLPEWEPYTADKGATMIFDNDCGMKYNHDKELLEVVMTFPVRGF